MKLLVVSCWLLVSVFSGRVFALSDIDDYPYKSAISMLHAKGIIDGYSDGTFKPNKAINRAEFLKLLMLSVYGNQVEPSGSVRCFADFTGQEQWFWPHACTAKELGIVEGHPDGTFRGEDTIILAEALKMSFDAWKVPLLPVASDEQWFAKYMYAAAPRGMFRRLPYEPGYRLSRGEMSLLLVMMREPIATLLKEPPEQTGAPIPASQAICGNGIIEGTEQCDDGNTENDDGCSDICIIVEQPIRHGALRVEQQSISVTDQSLGAKDVPLLAFTALAGRQDVFLTTLKFTAAEGSLQYATNYRLLADQDGDGTVESLLGRSNADGQTLTFAGQSILVKDGVYKHLEIWADIASNRNVNSLALAFDTSQPDAVAGVDRIGGEDVSGIELNDEGCTLDSICWVDLVTSTPQAVTVRSQGNLFVSKHSASTGPRQVLASTKTPTLLTLKLRADAEDIIIKQLAIDGVPSSVERLEFSYPGQSAAFAVGQSVNCSIFAAGRFCTDREFRVSKGDEVSVLVSAVLQSDSAGAVSGQGITLSVNGDTAGNVAIEAYGASSSKTLLQNDGSSTREGEIFIGTESPGPNSTITGPTHTVTLSRISSVTNGNNDPDDTPFTAGGLTFAEFAFAAANHDNTSEGANTADIDTLVFTVSAINAAFEAGSFYLYNALDASTVTPCTESTITGTITVTCQNLRSSPVSTRISRGDSVRLALRGTVQSTQLAAGGSIIQASLNTISNPENPGTILWSDEVSTFNWVDIGSASVKSTIYRLE